MPSVKIWSVTQRDVAATSKTTCFTFVGMLLTTVKHAFNEGKTSCFTVIES